jgi:hypothetical protein
MIAALPANVSPPRSPPLTAPGAVLGAAIRHRLGVRGFRQQTSATGR